MTKDHDDKVALHVLYCSRLYLIGIGLEEQIDGKYLKQYFYCACIYL